MVIDRFEHKCCTKSWRECRRHQSLQQMSVGTSQDNGSYIHETCVSSADGMLLIPLSPGPKNRTTAECYFDD